MIGQWLTPLQAPLATAFYRRCGSKEKAKGDERIAVLRNPTQQIVAVLRLAPKGEHWLLRALLVDPAYRRQGLALHLLQFIDAAVAEPIWCYPYPHLHGLYQRAGYQAQTSAPAPILAPYQAYCRKQPLLLMWRPPSV
ncbi:GNAT family N-acetyltransferase [uncultured Ferrimonas sp.]|uniref:GNAT family N-acetyltransferase n=1 Tax=uncultured Ferrimonas sp. TaxID=432640 RepID=UPI00260E87A8|nr:GNAT family N-acetyltransferase [uncultured Ferrimonas sp.]